MTRIAGVLWALWTIFKKTFLIFLPLFLCLCLFTVGRMIYRHKKYGYDYFSIFKKRELVDAKRIGILDVLKRIEPTAQIYEGNAYFSDVVAVMPFGILFLSIFPETNGKIEGDLSSSTLTFWVSKEHKKEISNPFYKQTFDFQKLLSKRRIPIYGYVVFDGLSLLMLKGSSSSKMIRTSDLYYTLEKLKKEHSIYTESEMETFFQEL